jgi:hypothetical protein
MTKYEEIAHLEYALNRISRLPANVTIGALYSVLRNECKDIKDSITAKEQFAHQWYKCTARWPPCAMPGHAQDSC